MISNGCVEIFKERMRMCNYYNDVPDMCNSCPRNNKGCELSTYRDCDYIKEYIADVEKWSKEHPKRTRLQDFLEKYPDAEVYDDGIPQVCCQILGYCKDCINAKGVCANCWNMPVEEDKQ